MRTIGLLGGMSWESSAEYYRIVNETVRDRLGGLHSARLVLDSVDFDEIERLQTSADWAGAAALLGARAAALQGAGAELIALCTNTMHKVMPEIEARVSVPVVHIGDATAAALASAGVARAGLLGTAFTMEQDFLSSRLESHGVEVVVPDADDRATVHRIIYAELVRGVVTEESRAAYRAVMQRLVDDGVQGIILGCTEIELLVTAADSPVPVFPTTRIHAEAVVAAALAPAAHA
jgi:aspartate racemase